MGKQILPLLDIQIKSQVQNLGTQIFFILLKFRLRDKLHNSKVLPMNYSKFLANQYNTKNDLRYRIMTRYYVTND